MLRVKAWQRLNLDPKKMLVFAGSLAGGSGLVVFSTTRDMMATDSPILSALVAAMVFYLACSLPRRVEASASFSQSREAPALAVLGSATLEATRSKSKAILFLRSGESAISSVLEGVRRDILLGSPPDVAVEQAAALASSSTYEVLKSICSPEQLTIADEGEEALAIEKSSQLGEETRSPLFVAAAFFVPLMLLLYAVMSHVAEPLDMVELVVLQVVILDVAFYFSTSDPRRGT
ncbi:MAG TPA: hypothetical protein VEC92_02385 [Nitrososphaerales archaeon]|nr:hypothetical protein [Nitrososphaerales archaeon]